MRILLPFFVALVSTGCMIRENKDWDNPLDPVNVGASGMVSIPAGTFSMGSGSPIPERRDESLRQIRLSAFLLDTVPVTQERWSAVMDTNPSAHQNCPNCPVENVTWFEAVVYCNKLSKRHGFDTVYTWSEMTRENRRIIDLKDIVCHRNRNGYRLPTEAEIEYALRAGATGTYPWGDDSLAYDPFAWVFTNSNGKTHPVATKRANAFGLYDMVGNVWQWGNDWYRIEYDIADTIDPMGPATGEQRVRRGGAYGFTVLYSTSANRGWLFPSHAMGDIGFRCARKASR